MQTILNRGTNHGCSSLQRPLLRTSCSLAQSLHRGDLPRSALQGLPRRSRSQRSSTPEVPRRLLHKVIQVQSQNPIPLPKASFCLQACAVVSEREGLGHYLARQRVRPPIPMDRRPNSIVGSNRPGQSWNLHTWAQPPLGRQRRHRLSAAQQDPASDEWTGGGRFLRGQIHLDATYLGGELPVRNAGRGPENKIPIVAAVSLKETGHPIHARFSAVSGFRSDVMLTRPSAIWAPVARRYLSGYCFRFNRRYSMVAMTERIAYAVCWCGPATESDLRVAFCVRLWLTLGNMHYLSNDQQHMIGREIQAWVQQKLSSNFLKEFTTSKI